MSKVCQTLHGFEKHVSNADVETGEVDFIGDKGGVPSWSLGATLEYVSTDGYGVHYVVKVTERLSRRNWKGLKTAGRCFVVVGRSTWEMRTWSIKELSIVAHVDSAWERACRRVKG